MKRIHRFGFTPKYTDSIYLPLVDNTFELISKKTFEKLGWEILHVDSQTVKGALIKHKKWHEIISVSYSEGYIEIISKSEQTNLWDLGRNSINVQKFIEAFHTVKSELSKEDIDSFIIEKNEVNNYWDNYVLPESLPAPIKSFKTYNKISISFFIITAILMGILDAYISTQFTHFLILNELVIGLIISFTCMFFIKKYYFEYYKRLDIIIWILSVIIVISSIVTDYFFNRVRTGDEVMINGLIHIKSYYVSFFLYWKIKFGLGFVFNDINIGWIGYILFWIIQVIIINYTINFSISISYNDWLKKKIPTEVVDFVYYFLYKNKSIEFINNELSKMGWDTELCQDEIYTLLNNYQEDADYMKNL